MKSFFLYLFFIFINTSFFQCFGLTTNLIPIFYNSSLPSINILVGGEEKSVYIDTAAAHLTLTLTQEILKKHAILTKEVCRSQDLLGKVAVTPIWKLNECSVSNLKFKTIQVIEHNPWGLDIRDEKSSEITEHPIDGVIGLQFFEGKRAILDFKNNKLQFVDSFPKNTDTKN